MKSLDERVKCVGLSAGETAIRQGCSRRSEQNASFREKPTNAEAAGECDITSPTTEYIGPAKLSNRLVRSNEGQHLLDLLSRIGEHVIAIAAARNDFPHGR